MISELHQHCGLSLRHLAKRLRLSGATLRRWRRRSAQGQPLLQKPGPKKLAPLPFAEVQREIEALIHARKRSRGAGALYARHHHEISRRDIASRVAAHRAALRSFSRDSLRRVRWHHPNLAWAIDATEYRPDQRGRKLFLVVAMDLASRFTFAPLVTLCLDGDQVTDYLSGLFRQHGLPLLLKRDNGSVFNHHQLDALLAAEAILPLNSPAYYPPYNGGVEKGIRDFKAALADCLPSRPNPWPPEAAAACAAAAAHLRNCAPRRCLNGVSSVQAYHQQCRFTCARALRHAAFDWIKCRASGILCSTQSPTRRHASAAWRVATQLWLERQNLITITKKPNCVTPF